VVASVEKLAYQRVNWKLEYPHQMPNLTSQVRLYYPVTILEQGVIFSDLVSLMLIGVVGANVTSYFKTLEIMPIKILFEYRTIKLL